MSGLNGPVDIFPLFEDDLHERGIISPGRPEPGMPTAAVLCFFPEVLADVPAWPDARLLRTLRSELGPTPVWEVRPHGTPVALLHPGVGAPLAAAMLEEVIAMGARRIVLCGGAGALVPDLVLGHAVVVDSALRDEGTSLHYLPAGRTVDVAPPVVAAVVETLAEAGVEHVVGRTWTTDAFYRETPGRIARRVAEGCIVVDMEVSALLAVAAFRGVELGAVLMAGDSLAGADWDHRGWNTAESARRRVAELALAAATRLAT